MKMNDEIKSKIQEHINEACRDHMDCYADWLYDGFVENNELSKFEWGDELGEAFYEYEGINFPWRGENVDCPTTKLIIKDTIEWAKENLGVELDRDDIGDYYFPICDVDEWDITIEESAIRVLGRWLEVRTHPTARELVKELKDIGKNGPYEDIRIAKFVGRGVCEWEYKKIKDIGDLYEASLFGYGICFLDAYGKTIIVRLYKMKETNITAKVLETMAKSIFKEAA